MSERYGFINTPLEDVLKEGMSAMSDLNRNGIGAVPVINYVMPTIFLNSTGFIEQKLRTIHWSLGNVTMDLRYKIMRGDSKYGEYSNYKDKNSLYKLIRGDESENAVYGDVINIEEIEKKNMVDIVKQSMNDIFYNSVLIQTYGSVYNETMKFIAKREFSDIANKELLNDRLRNIYGRLYLQRNRLAHNLMAHQQDSDSFDEIAFHDRHNCNYFTYFALLLLLDRIFQKMFEERMRKMGFSKC